MKSFNSLKNERSNSYVLPNSIDDMKDLLSNPVIDGVFGVEIHKYKDVNTSVLFTPQYFKLNYQKTDRDSIFDSLEGLGKEFTIAKFFLGKSSVFPIDTDWSESFYSIVEKNIPINIGFAYQLMLSFRQDDWKERLKEQYAYYLNGIENPYDSKMLRNIQKKINDSICNTFNIKYKHNPIREVQNKINDVGFMYSIKLVLYNGSKKSRVDLLKKIQNEINVFSYVNKWEVEMSNRNLEIDNIIERRISSAFNTQVLSASEILPLITKSARVDNLEMINTKIADIIDTVNHDDSVGNSINNSNLSYSNLIKTLPYGEELKNFNSSNIANKFIKALTEVKKSSNSKDFKLKNSQSGSTLMRMVISIPSSIRLSEITKASVIEDIQVKMGVKHLQIQQGEDRNEINVTLPLEDRQKVLLRNYIDSDDFRKFSNNNNLPFLVGVDEIGNPIYQCLNKARHILVAGTTGSGKSVWINQLILTLLLTKNPSELIFYMIDVKKVELSIYRKFPHVKSVITDADESINLLARLTSEMERRYGLLEESGVKNINTYNNKNPKNKIPYIVCIIDEYAELALKNQNVHNHVQTLAQLSRASGIHLVIATQDPRKEVIPPIIKSNLPSKIGLRCSNVHSYMTFLNSRPPFNLLGNGDGVMAFEGQMDEYVRFQGCIITNDTDEDSESALIEDIADKINSDEYAYELPNAEEEVVELEIDKLKKVIATTGETRVSNLRNIMKVNINRLNEMMKELVDEGWLEKPHSKQQGYKLILDNEELQKWK